MTSPSIDDRPPFERLAGESPKAYAAFCRYRDLPPASRSIDRAWRNAHPAQSPHRRRSKTWAEWSRRWGWVERAALYDAHLERQRQRALEDEQVEASRRHARSLQAAMSSLMIPVRVALETAASSAGLDALRAAARADVSGLRAVVADARAAAAHLSQLVAAERLVLGLTTSRDEIRDVPMHDTIAAAIVSSPDATHAAVQLLDAIAQAAPTPVENG